MKFRNRYSGLCLDLLIMLPDRNTVLGLRETKLGLTKFNQTFGKAFKKFARSPRKAST
jgi:hypothetical protein